MIAGVISCAPCCRLADWSSSNGAKSLMAGTETHFCSCTPREKSGLIWSVWSSILSFAHVIASSTIAHEARKCSQKVARAASYAATDSSRCTQWLNSFRSRSISAPEASDRRWRVGRRGSVGVAATVASLSLPSWSTTSRRPTGWCTGRLTKTTGATGAGLRLVSECTILKKRMYLSRGPSFRRTCTSPLPATAISFWISLQI
mmetsp:Transcript_9916/g.25519  ORF Transcript_9916/g.25519 Transcript_9916/m.25519 type:complete len:203 (-) Transcript_9916:82-690(-)